MEFKEALPKFINIVDNVLSKPRDIKFNLVFERYALKTGDQQKIKVLLVGEVDRYCTVEA